MLNDKMVTYRVWNETGVVAYGQITYGEATQKMRDLEREAKEVLDKTGADHVVYGAKKYTESGYIFNYYMIPMDDERFYRDVWGLDDTIVYALHKIK